MLINKVFNYTPQLKLNIFRKLYHFHIVRNGFIRSVNYTDPKGNAAEKDLVSTL